ncbi:MAG: hypothetical protein WDN28_24465 [Chthoniobacter sp.]
MPLRLLTVPGRSAVRFSLPDGQGNSRRSMGKLADQKPDDPERKEMVKVQILLDRADFRPARSTASAANSPKRRPTATAPRIRFLPAPAST